MISCDVADEDASFIVGDLRRMGIAQLGAIDITQIDASVSLGADKAEAAAVGRPADAVIWENVSARIDNQGLISTGMIALFGLSGVIAVVAILIDSAPIVVGAMALCPDFGPIAAFAVGVAPDVFNATNNTLAQTIAAPNIYSVIVALCAGAAGMLSVTLGKSGALVGVAVSITTIPAAAAIGLSLSYSDWSTMTGASGQLAVNIASLLLSATLMLAFQRRNYRRHSAQRRNGR